ncbi:RagB/SusD family nutrient uptake outer membrane protein [Flagellimonas sp.]|uniref:RagB/SusD family nutrient uptake outer membrane protein n=1 Tax=Flagellimonas sp. TaxID=2058762 RepID=UPI003AB32640
MKYIEINLFRYFTFTVLVLLFIGCEDFVEIDPPESELVRETVFSNDKTAEAALMDIYGQLRSTTVFNGQISGFSSLLGHYSDELTLFNNTSLVEPFYQHTLVPGNSQLTTIWNNCYNLIYASNAILEGLDNSSNITVEISQQLQGEALFIRAFIHFYLVNLFGDIPYITGVDYRANAVVNRMDTAEVYAHIIEDLKQSKTSLGETYTTGERIRPNRFAASALLARVYLYSEQWQLAETEASEIINQSIYDLLPLNEVFLKNNQEAIWQFKPETSVGNTLEAQTFIFTTAPPHTTALTQTLVNSFETGDQRFVQWVGSVENDNEAWYYSHKYKLNTSTSQSEEYSTVFRLAEQYLIRAEARARLGTNTAEAIADLDVIRDRANLPLIAETNPGIGQAQLLDVIMHERQVELFTEFGHRWFDLKRTGRAMEVLDDLKPGWKDTDNLLPIPETELLANPNLEPQNPGYN